MLEELSIQNLALVDRLVLRFTSGFQVLTGETGAGKSILVGALSLLHGGRADTESIRTGSDEAVVSGVFLVKDESEAFAWLQQRGIEIEEGAVIVRRSVRKTGRGSIYIQSSPVTRSDLAEFAGYVFDLHGQHEHQSLLASDQQRRLLDRYAGIEERVAEFSRSFSELSERRKHFDRMLAGEREQLREREFLEFAVSEIDLAQLKPGEEEELEQERRILAEHERVFALLEDSYGGLAENRGGALSSLRRVRDAVDGLSAIDPAMAPLAKRLEDSFFELEDISEQIRDYHSGIEFRPERVEACNERLAAIHKLEKKYGVDISEVLRYRDEAAERINGFATWEEDKERLSAELHVAEKAVRAEAQAISEMRRAAGERLAAAITEVVQRLGLQRARFAAHVGPRSGENGKAV
ncbi:MAG: AAA family ATPase, partial [Spirochaeta sp.]|nr:AAA family ATPase [Spirochaeta sp.]